MLLKIGHEGFSRRNRPSTMTQQLDITLSNSYTFDKRQLDSSRISIDVVATISSNIPPHTYGITRVWQTLYVTAGFAKKNTSTYLDLHTRDVTRWRLHPRLNETEINDVFDARAPFNRWISKFLKHLSIFTNVGTSRAPFFNTTN